MIVPNNYSGHKNVVETEIAIKTIKDFFQKKLAENMNLVRVSAPLFVREDSGLNDGLNGIERPVSFDAADINSDLQIVQSLAKWKRLALYKYGFDYGNGLYTDMNAIRRDETVDNIHSIYVDQWDWEKVITKENRNLEFLKAEVNKIYDAFLSTEKFISEKINSYKKILPDKITFITAEELLGKYPDLSAKEREYRIVKENGAVFIIGIGKKLSDGKAHDNRAADYDDWDLNGDIIFYHPVLDIALELSSMGIRVDGESLARQLKIKGEEYKSKYDFHKGILDGTLPLTIGGGIGQSRICMFFLQKAHIGEVQVSVWPENEKKQCAENNIFLL